MRHALPSRFQVDDLSARLSASQRSSMDLRAQLAARDAEVEKFQVGVLMTCLYDAACKCRHKNAACTKCALQALAEAVLHSRAALETGRSHADSGDEFVVSILCCLAVLCYTPCRQRGRPRALMLVPNTTMQDMNTDMTANKDGGPYYNAKQYTGMVGIHCDDIQHSETQQDAEHSHAGIDVQHCLVCCSNLRDTSLNCGHLVCKDCSTQLLQCPCCRTPITKRSHVYV